MSDIPNLLATWTAISLVIALVATFALTVALVVGRCFSRTPETA
ncbi:MAG: hypothetical protein JJLCMIEE_03348 [Acidimicrobiales bacterium]|nr:hypothetical protein [Acidimicrobiales bacterium]